MSRAPTSADRAPGKRPPRRGLISRGAISRTSPASSALERVASRDVRSGGSSPSRPYSAAAIDLAEQRPMASPVARFTTRLTYGARQLSRVAWYVRHDFVMRRPAEEARRRAGARARPRAHTDRPVPDRSRLYADMATLFRQDLANVEAGIYPLPADHDGSWPVFLERSRLFFEDLPQVH